MIFFTISYMACSSSSNLRHRYFRKIRSPHRKAKPVWEHGAIKGSHHLGRLRRAPGLTMGQSLCWRLRQAATVL